MKSLLKSKCACASVSKYFRVYRLEFPRTKIAVFPLCCYSSWCTYYLKIISFNIYRPLIKIFLFFSVPIFSFVFAATFLPDGLIVNFDGRRRKEKPRKAFRFFPLYIPTFFSAIPFFGSFRPLLIQLP